MNTNLGNIPLDIFADYVSEQLDVEYNWIYLYSLHFYHSSNKWRRTTYGCYEEAGNGCELYYDVIHNDFDIATGDGGGFGNLGSAYYHCGQQGGGASLDHEY